MNRNVKNKRNVERLVNKINKNIFIEDDIKKLLAELREYTNNPKYVEKIKHFPNKEFAEAYEYLIDIMHGAYAHSIRNRGPMYDWAMGSINLMQSFRQGDDSDKFDDISKKEGLNNFVIDERIVFWFQVIIKMYLEDAGSLIEVDEKIMQENRMDILLCMLCILQTNELKLSENKGYVKLYLFAMPTLDSFVDSRLELRGDIILEDRFFSLGISKTLILYKQEKQFGPHLQSNPLYESLGTGRLEVKKHIEYDRDLYEAVRNDEGSLYLKLIS